MRAWAPPVPSALDTVATPPIPQTFTLQDVVSQLAAIRQELADALWKANPGTPAVMLSPGFVTFLVVKQTPGILYGLDIHNNSGSTRFAQVFDVSSDGVTVPADGIPPTGPIISIATVTSVQRDWGYRGYPCKQGILIVSSSTANTKTITATADLWIAARYL